MRNKLFKISTYLILIFIFSGNLFSQLSGDYRSRLSGEWRNNTSWEIFSGGNWIPASFPPSGTSGTITIRQEHTITVGAGTDTIIIDGASVVVNGYLKEIGIIKKTSGSWVINGTFELARSPAAGLGLPTATWSDGSTCLLTGITSATTGLNALQNFYNLTIDCPNWSANLNLGWTRGTVTIRGNLKVQSTGSGRWNMAAPLTDSSVVINILGDIIVTAGVSSSNLVSVTSTGTSNPNSHITVNVYGNVLVTGNPANTELTNFSISRGSQGGSGTATWNFYGDVSISNARIQNSTGTALGGLGKFAFVKNGAQKLTLINLYNATSAAINIEVSSSSNLDVGNSTLTGSNGFFKLNDGATLLTSNISGVDGFLTNTGDKILSENANYKFNGTSSQVTGMLLPATVNDLTIDNPAGVTLSKPITVNGKLYLTNGVLNNCTNNVTVPASNIVYGNGSFQCAPNSVNPLDAIPAYFYVYQNYPNPFNPVTNIKFQLPNESNLTIKIFDFLGKEISTIFEGKLQAGIHQLSFDASNLSSGVYLYQIQTEKNVAARQMTLIK